MYICFIIFNCVHVKNKDISLFFSRCQFISSSTSSGDVIGVCCYGEEGKDTRKKGGKHMTWSLNKEEAISSNVFILNGGI